MVVYTPSHLQICIAETSPNERRDWLIKAIAAAIRWNGLASESDKYASDGENVVVLAQLLEELVDIQNTVE